MKGTSGISLFLWLCAATFCFQTISGVGVDILEIPLKCYMRLDHGDGKQMISRYYYNEKTSRCRRFIFNGHNGNQNNFKSLKECIQVCNGLAPKEDDIAQNLVLTTTVSFKIPIASKQVKQARNKIKATLNRLLTDWTRYFRMIFSR